MRESFLSSSPAEARGKVGVEGDRPSEGLLERQEGKDLAGQPEDGEMSPFNWRSIDTAPRDGTPIMVIESGHWTGRNIPRILSVWWEFDNRMKDGGYWSDGSIEMILATHWYPLPEMPLTHV